MYASRNTYYTSHIFFVSGTPITWQCTQGYFTLNTYIRDTIRNNNIITPTSILSHNIQRLQIHISHYLHIKFLNLSKKLR